MSDQKVELDPEGLMTPTEVAAMLNCSPHLLTRRRAARQAPKFFYLSSNRVRYRRRDIIAFIKTLEAK